MTVSTSVSILRRINPFKSGAGHRFFCKNKKSGGITIDSYQTIKNEARAEYIVKKSRFICSAAPVTSVQDANEFIERISKEFWSATHNVYAYSLLEGSVKKFSDAGEPQGTAGKPCLEAIEKSGVCDACVVITRYFGGIMLGAGGLVRAYSHSAALALEAGKIITRGLCVHELVVCDYGFYSKLAALIPAYNGIIENTCFENNVSIYFRLPQGQDELFNKKLTDVSGGKLTAKILNTSYEEI